MLNSTLMRANDFDLTLEEENIITSFVNNLTNAFDPDFNKYEKSAFGDNEKNKAIKNIEFSNQKWKWFFQKALFEAVDITKHKNRNDELVFVKVLPDRNVVEFGLDELNSTLKLICKFFFQKSFGHRYTSLVSLSQSWADIDNYVVQRQQLINLKNLQNEFPEITGTLNI